MSMTPHYGEGQLVWIQDHGVKGCHKIQDLWRPVVCRLMRVPHEGGSVYTIAPADDEIHCSKWWLVRHLGVASLPLTSQLIGARQQMRCLAMGTCLC